jgi:transcriptional regulator GlxA family with amidase domain
MSTRPFSVCVVALTGSTAFVPVGVAELFKKAADLSSLPSGPRARRPVSVTVVGENPRLATAGGWPLLCDRTFAKVRSADLVIVSALDPDVVARLEENRAAVRFVRRMHRAGAHVASACTGAFVLAEAGLLDGHRATTHWAFQSLFSARYPRIHVEPQAIVVDQGRVCTAGGATSFINLTQYLIERHLGAPLARAASKMFLIDANKAPQGAYAIFASQKEHGDAEILRAQEHIEGNARSVAVAELARRAAMSTRTFLRRFKEATGNTPLVYVQRVRVEAAKRALEDSHRSLATIARDVGYEDPVAFRRVFARATGLTPADYRKRYGPMAKPSLILAR